MLYGNTVTLYNHSSSSVITSTVSSQDIVKERCSNCSLFFIFKILMEQCELKVKKIEAEICPDHVHMFVEIPPKMSVLSFMGYLKGKSSVIFHERHGNLKFKYGNRSFWCRGYYVDTVGKNAKRIAEYIQNQLKEGQISDQMTLREMKDLFTGSK